MMAESVNVPVPVLIRPAAEKELKSVAMLVAKTVETVRSAAGLEVTSLTLKLVKVGLLSTARPRLMKIEPEPLVLIVEAVLPVTLTVFEIW